MLNVLDWISVTAWCLVPELASVLLSILDQYLPRSFVLSQFSVSRVSPRVLGAWCQIIFGAGKLIVFTLYFLECILYLIQIYWIIYNKPREFTEILPGFLYCHCWQRREMILNVGSFDLMLSAGKWPCRRVLRSPRWLKQFCPPRIHDSCHIFHSLILWWTLQLHD